MGASGACSRPLERQQSGMAESSTQTDSAAQGPPEITEIRDWLVSQVAAELQISPEKIQTDQPVYSYGIDSMQVVTVIAEFEDWLGFRFDGNPLEDHPTIEALAVEGASRAAGQSATE